MIRNQDWPIVYSTMFGRQLDEQQVEIVETAARRIQPPLRPGELLAAVQGLTRHPGGYRPEGIDIIAAIKANRDAVEYRARDEAERTRSIEPRCDCCEDTGLVSDWANLPDRPAMEVCQVLCLCHRGETMRKSACHGDTHRILSSRNWSEHVVRWLDGRGWKAKSARMVANNLAGQGLPTDAPVPVGRETVERMAADLRGKMRMRYDMVTA